MIKYLINTLAVIAVAAVVTLILALHALFDADRPVLKVTMTGVTHNELVEWKNPHGQLDKRLLPTYEVRLETPSGELLATHFLLGDQVAIKAKVIRFAPLLNTLGIKNRCQIEALHNSYTSAERGNALPTQYRALNLTRSILWRIWAPLYYLQERHTALIHSATLESNYFPLVDRQGLPVQSTYLLTITPGGLSSISH